MWCHSWIGITLAEDLIRCRPLTLCSSRWSRLHLRSPSSFFRDFANIACGKVDLADTLIGLLTRRSSCQVAIRKRLFQGFITTRNRRGVLQSCHGEIHFKLQLYQQPWSFPFLFANRIQEINEITKNTDLGWPFQASAPTPGRQSMQ